jgi:hypothetical protein
MRRVDRQQVEGREDQVVWIIVRRESSCFDDAGEIW